MLLSGAEDSLRMRFLQDLLDQASGGDDFDLETFVGDASNPSQWLASAGTAPFLSPRRTVVVRNVLRADPKDFNPSPLPDTALLILVADDETGDSERQRKLDSTRTAWNKKIPTADGIVLDFAIDAKQISEAIRDEAGARGKKVSPRAAELLREMCGGSLSRSMEELEKLVLFASDAGEIRESDIRAVAVASPEWNIFGLIDAITRGDTGASLRQLQILAASNSKVEDVAFSTIFPLMSTQLKMIWQARACIEAGVTVANAPESLTSTFLERPNFAKEQEWKRNRAMATARTLDFDALTKCFTAMSDADARLKGQLPAFSNRETLDRMVLEMVEAVAKR